MHRNELGEGVLYEERNAARLKAGILIRLAALARLEYEAASEKSAGQCARTKRIVEVVGGCRREDREGRMVDDFAAWRLVVRGRADARRIGRAGGREYRKQSAPKGLLGVAAFVVRLELAQHGVELVEFAEHRRHAQQGVFEALSGGEALDDRA